MAVKKLPSVPEVVDRLGRTKADIAKLKAVEEKDITALKKRGVGEYCGELFQARIFTQERGKLVNWEAVAKELKASAVLIKRFTVTRTVTDVNWESIAQELQPDEKTVEKHTTVAQPVTVCKVTARQTGG